MTYSTRQFAIDLAQEIRAEPLNYGALAGWAYKTRLEHLGSLSAQVSKWLEQMGAMDMGPEFRLSRQELDDLVQKALEGD